MNRHILTTSLLLMVAGSITAQPYHDNIWLLSSLNGSVEINFETGEPVVTQVDLARVFHKGATYISDELGELAFYTNGCQIYNRNDQLMENGAPINPGVIYDMYCNLDGWGYPGPPQSSITLTWPDRNDEYLIIHKANDFIYDSSGNIIEVSFPFLYYSHVDMRENNGLGAVVVRNQVIEEANHEAGALASVRHANGRDWWTISPLRTSNEYAVYLLDSVGFTHVGYQATGPVELRSSEAGGQSVFSPDGSKYLRFTLGDGLQIWDFDRASGLLSNYRHVPFPPQDIFEISGYGGVGISPSGQYAYVSNSFEVFQYDLEADHIGDSRIKVGEVINSDSLFILPTLFNFQLGPDCKLYGHNNSGDSYHVIHHPDSAGVACGFEQGYLQLPFWVFRDEPHFPNYRLGPLGNEGSPCAVPLVSSNADLVAASDPVYLTAWPNPASGPVALSLSGLLPGRAASAQWVLYDAIGREVLRRELVSGSVTQIQRPQGAAGIYYWQLRDSASKQELDRGKIVWR
jgi:hypothetical protein